MDNKKVTIKIYDVPTKKDAIHGGLGFLTGFTIRDIVINGEKQVEGNYAFGNLFFNCLRLKNPEYKGEMAVLRTVSLTTFESEKKNFINNLKETYLEIVQSNITKELFDQAKEKTKRSFETQYKKAQFRAKYKAFEFSELNKRFRLKELISDIENISFEKFIELSKIIFSPGNMRVCIIGECGENFENELTKIGDLFQEMNQEVDFKINLYDPYLVQDAHIMAVSREPIYVNVERFDFLNPETTVFAKYLITDILSSVIPADNVEVYADEADASIIVTTSSLVSYRPLMGNLKEEEFIKCKERVVNKYLYLMRTHPDEFLADALVKMWNHVSVDEYMNFCNRLTYEMFMEICNTADYKISEAQVVFGGNR